MRQVVTEVWFGDNCDISLSYDYEPRLEGYKEREELVITTKDGKIVTYWVRVAREVKTVGKSREETYAEQKQRNQDKYLEKKKIKKEQIAKLLAQKENRINYYKSCVENGQPIDYDDPNDFSIRKLSEVTNNRDHLNRVLKAAFGG